MYTTREELSPVQPIHAAVKGRVRLRVHGLRRMESLKARLELGLGSEEGISGARASTLTGTLLVLFDPTCRDLHQVTVLVENLVVAEGVAAHRPLTPDDGRAHTAEVSAFRPQNSEERSRRQTRKLVTHAQAQPVEPWHTLEAETVMSRVEGLTTGLSVAEAGARLKKFGPNLLPEALPRSALSILLDQFKSLPVALLGASAVISAFTGGLVDAVVIMSVVGINAVIGYYTESRAEKTINALTRVVRPAVLVFREQRKQEIRAEDVVIGDLLILAPGSYIAADARLIAAKHLSVDESALTGESMPVSKAVQPLDAEDTPLADRVNMLYMGTLVTGGQGLAVVVATGRYTEMGNIQVLVGEAVRPETPMQRQLDVLGRQLVILGGAVCGVVFAVGMLRGYGVVQMLKSAIALAVAAVPEGLPTVATTTLALGLGEMRRHKILVRHLDAVETLGSVQVMCMDKTGTLTLNRMSVVTLFGGMERIGVRQGVFFGAAEVIDPFARDELLRLLHAAALCNETEINGGNGGYVLKGTPTEGALVQLAIDAGVDVIELRRNYPLLKVDHRAENRNYMSTLHETSDGTRIVAVKGSPVEVLAMCRRHVQDGTKQVLTDDARSSITAENERMAGDALRVLGVAYACVDDDQNAFAGQELIWLGLIGMADPIRPGVKELIDLFHQAGIDTIMITGDQSPTAYAIGKALDLSSGRQIEILDSTHLDKVDPALLSALAQRVDVFARVSPAHKLQIVQALQRAGKVVAMTGDGINDSPALKTADIGVAMGHTGTDVARSVADVVLEDDDLQTMIIAVSQGRTIYSNIRKSVHFLLATNLSEIMVMFAAIGVGAGQPLNPMQLLWINLLSDIFPGLALALEPPEPDVLRRPPRDPREPIVRKTDLKRIGLESAVISGGALAAYGYGVARYGIGAQAGTLAFMSLTSTQLLHALSCRSESHGIFCGESLPPNKYLNVALAGSFGVQLAAAFVPGLRGLLGTTPLGLVDGLVIGTASVLPLAINEGTKTLLGRNKGNAGLSSRSLIPEKQ